MMERLWSGIYLAARGVCLKHLTEKDAFDGCAECKAEREVRAVARRARAIEIWNSESAKTELRETAMKLSKVAVLAVAFLAAVVIAIGQQVQQGTAGANVTPKAPYDSTHAQLLFERQKNAQLKAQALQQQYTEMAQKFQTDFQSEEKDLNAWIEQVRRANGWDASYNYDRENDRWTRAEKQAPAAPSKPTAK